MVRATAVVHKHEPRRRVELPPRSRWFDSVPVPFFSFPIYDSEWNRAGGPVGGSRDFDARILTGSRFAAGN